MSGSRFAQLSLVDSDDDDAGRHHHDPPSSGKNNKSGRKRNKKKKAKTRSSVFTWSVLCDSNLNKVAPRGLVNRSNFCYLNAVLQPLLLCQPVVNVILNLQDKIREGGYKWLSAFLHLATSFSVDDAVGSDGTTAAATLPTQSVVSPECVYKCWEHTDDQEDAEEFLRLILNGLHEELLANKQQLQWDLPTLCDGLKSISKQTVEDEWICVVKGQKGATSRQLLEPPSPISVLFNGQWKSILKQRNNRDSHVYEPFQFLPLDLTDCDDIASAIGRLMLPERLSPTTTRQLLIDRLPPILVLQLKRFVFDAATCTTTKSLAHIHIPADLDLSDTVHNYGDFVFFDDTEPPQYRLTAVIYHLGRTTHGGHYTCHVLHDDTWYYCDDGAVQTAPRELVGQTDRNRTPYLLFYSRRKPVV